MENKVMLTNITKEDAAKLFNNQNVWDKVTEQMSEQAASIVLDFLSCLDGVSNYSISDSSNPSNFLTVSNTYKFLESLDRLNEDYVLLDQELVNSAKELLQKYNNTESEAKLEKLENNMDILANQVSDILLNKFIKEYDVIYNDDLVKEDILEYATYIYGEDAIYNREENKIYYASCD